MVVKANKELMSLRNKLVELIEENNELRQEIQELNEMLDLYEEEINKLEREKMIDDVIIGTFSRILKSRKRR